MKHALKLLIFTVVAFSSCKHKEPPKGPENVDTAIVGSNLKASEDIADQIQAKTDYVLKNWETAK